jgi:ribosomal protein L40E
MDRAYLHVWLPAQRSLATAFQAVEGAVASVPGWAPAIGDGGGNDGYRVWRHRDTGAALLAVAVGLDPLVLSIGQGTAEGDDLGGGESGAARAALRDAVAAVRRGAPAFGGREVSDAGLLPLVRQARERLEWRVAAEARAEALERRLGQRVCPSCGAWSRYQARWCQGCRYEFSPSDNFQRDEGRGAAERELAELRPHLEDTASGATPGGTT